MTAFVTVLCNKQLDKHIHCLWNLGEAKIVYLTVEAHCSLNAIVVIILITIECF